MATIQLQCADREVVQPLPAVCMSCGRPSARMVRMSLISLAGGELLTHAWRVIFAVTGEALFAFVRVCDSCSLPMPVCPSHGMMVRILQGLRLNLAVGLLVAGILAPEAIRRGQSLPFSLAAASGVCGLMAVIVLVRWQFAHAEDKTLRTVTLTNVSPAFVERLGQPAIQNPKSKI